MDGDVGVRSPPNASEGNRMPLVHCPECNHAVANVASTCPHCASSLDRGQGAEPRETFRCSRCKATIFAHSPVCCNCGAIDPKPLHPLIAKRTIALVAVVLLVLGGSWTRFAGSSSPEPIPPVPSAVENRSTVSAARVVEVTGPKKHDDVEVRWTSTWVNVRQSRSLDSPVLIVLDPGERVEVSNRQGPWWQAHLNGRPVGYLSNAVLTAAPIEPAEH
jgi:Bacterial SH3 domain